MKLSIVTTLYKSAPHIDEFHTRMTAAALKITDNYEIIIVDDGSPDDALKKSLAIQSADPHVSVVELSRNFGHHKAMMTGLMHSCGDYVLMIDTDMEEVPELLGSYWEALQSQPDIDVVYGKLLARKGSLWEKMTGGLFYRLMNLLSGEEMPIDIAFSRLMRRNYVENLIRFGEREMYIGGLWHIAGFRQVPLVVKKNSRGVSSYTLRKKMEMLLNALTAFTSMPLRMIFYLGLFTTTTSILSAIFVVLQKFLLREVMSGWTSLILVVLIMSGIIILSLGVIAIYLSKIFIEVKNRPYTIVRNVHSRKEMRS